MILLQTLGIVIIVIIVAMILGLIIERVGDLISDIGKNHRS